jgi:uncharacterized membrane protein YdjX (TVP38/TMEM64 family)
VARLWSRRADTEIREVGEATEDSFTLFSVASRVVAVLHDLTCLRELRARAFRGSFRRYIADMGLTLREVGSRVAKLAGMLVPIGLGLGASKLASPYMPAFTAWVNALGVWAPAVFVGGYVLATVCMMPAFLLTIAGGAVFGLATGSVLVFIGSTVGAAIAFTLGRTVLRRWVAAQIAKNPTLMIVDRVVGEEGLKLMFLLRLSGIAPFVLTNYAMGVTSVRLSHFLFAMLGMIPTIATYAALGQAGAQTPGKGAIPSWMLWMGVTAAVVLAVTVTRVVQKALREAQVRENMQALAVEAAETAAA